MTLRDLIKLVTPPLFIHLAKRLSDKWSAAPYGLSGEYRSWAEAMAASTGYDSEVILEKTKVALLKVKTGEAIYERDSVLFDEIEYAWPVLAGFMWVAARCGGTLNVLDFGGSLGSTYFQNRVFLSALSNTRWNIVEQASHVGIGKVFFEDDHLRFYADIAGCLAETRPNIVLLSSVLQYLECPYAVFDQILALPCNYVIVDRTSFWNGPTDRLCVQTVPPSIYPATYPSWILSRSQFHNHLHLHKDWKVVATFDNPDKLAGPIDFVYQGVIIARNTQVS